MSIDNGYAASTGYKLQGPFAGLENHFQWMCSGADVGPVRCWLSLLVPVWTLTWSIVTLIRQDWL